MVIVILLVLGLCLGSFVNAYVWRLHAQEELRGDIEELEYEIEQHQAKKIKLTGTGSMEKKIQKHRAAIRELSIWHGRSRCTHCGHELSSLDLIPVVSYLLLGRKCRYCRKPIDDTPVAELMTPALFVLSYIFWPHPITAEGGQLAAFVVWLICCVGFVALTLYDLRWKILPNRIVLPLIGLAVLHIIIQSVLYHGGDMVAAQAFWGVLTASGIFRILYEVSAYLRSAGRIASEWIGFGDVRLGVLLGLLVGGPANGLLLLFAASVIGTAVAVPLMLSGRAERRTHIPYGPFLIAGAVIVRLWGPQLVDWYTGLMVI